MRMSLRKLSFGDDRLVRLAKDWRPVPLPDPPSGSLSLPTSGSSSNTAIVEKAAGEAEDELLESDASTMMFTLDVLVTSPSPSTALIWNVRSRSLGRMFSVKENAVKRAP